MVCPIYTGYCVSNYPTEKYIFRSCNSKSVTEKISELPFWNSKRNSMVLSNLSEQYWQNYTAKLIININVIHFNCWQNIFISPRYNQYRAYWGDELVSYWFHWWKKGLEYFQVDKFLLCWYIQDWTWSMIWKLNILTNETKIS